MIHADRFSGERPVAHRADGRSSHGVNVRLVDPGQQPLELLGALFQMGCPAELAYDYLEAAVLGNEPEVLVGAETTAAIQLAETLRNRGQQWPSTLLSSPRSAPEQSVRALDDGRAPWPSRARSLFEPRLVVGPDPRPGLAPLSTSEPSLVDPGPTRPGPAADGRAPVELEEAVAGRAGTASESTIVLSDHQPGRPRVSPKSTP